jgi:hypothetical protein
MRIIARTSANLLMLVYRQIYFLEVLYCLEKKEDKDGKHICLYGDHARGDKGLANQT